MARKSLGVRYVCSNCGAISTTWTGRCRVCGEWNTLQEQVEVSTTTAGASGNRLKVETVNKAAAAKTKRISTKISDVDDVLGGGLVAGSVNLLAGQPGIGKSTLLLQIANNIAHSYRVLYVSGEESGQQIALRADRLDITSKSLQFTFVSLKTFMSPLLPNILKLSKYTFNFIRDFLLTLVIVERYIFLRIVQRVHFPTLNRNERNKRNKN